MKENINGWIMEEFGYPIASYGAEFIIEDSMIIKSILSMIGKIIDISNKYKICQLLPDSIQQYYNFDLRNEYLIFLEKEIQEKKIVNPFSAIKFPFYPNDRLLAQSTLLAFFDNKGNILQDDILELDNIDFEANYTNYKIGANGMINIAQSGTYGGYKTPIDISMESVRTETNNVFPYSWSFAVSLGSDIWLPIVNSYRVYKSEYDFEWLGEVDNTPLAIQHTARLNSFLRDLKNIVLDNNGQWFFETPSKKLHKLSGMKYSPDEDSDKIWCDCAIPINGELIYAD